MAEDPRLRVNGDSIVYNGRQVGQYGVDESTGRIVAVFWKPLFRKENSYALSCDLYRKIDDSVRIYFVVDGDSNELYKFHADTYYNARIVYGGGERQFAPDIDENIGRWPDADDHLL